MNKQLELGLGLNSQVEYQSNFQENPGGIDYQGLF